MTDRRLVCVTAIFGGYERPKPPPEHVDRAVLLTDETADPRWEILARPDHGLSKLRHFFVGKLVPHVGIDAADDVLWIDGSMRPTGRDVRELVALVPPGGVGIHRHHARDCYHVEGHWTAWAYKAPHERGALAAAQADSYAARGCPQPSGLWETGIIVWRGAQRTLGERWFAETMTWSSSDQVSLPYALHVTGCAVTDLPGSVYADPWFAFVPHGQ